LFCQEDISEGLKALKAGITVASHHTEVQKRKSNWELGKKGAKKVLDKVNRPRKLGMLDDKLKLLANKGYKGR
jgi:hypothetical protein